MAAMTTGQFASGGDPRTTNTSGEATGEDASQKTKGAERMTTHHPSDDPVPVPAPSDAPLSLAALLAYLDPNPALPVIDAALIRQRLDAERAYLDGWLGIAIRANDLTAQLVIQRRLHDLACEQQALDGPDDHDDPDCLEAQQPEEDQPPTVGA